MNKKRKPESLDKLAAQSAQFVKAFNKNTFSEIPGKIVYADGANAYIPRIVIRFDNNLGMSIVKLPLILDIEIALICFKSTDNTDYTLIHPFCSLVSLFGGEYSDGLIRTNPEWGEDTVAEIVRIANTINNISSSKVKNIMKKRKIESEGLQWT